MLISMKDQEVYGKFLSEDNLKQILDTIKIDNKD